MISISFPFFWISLACTFPFYVPYVNCFPPVLKAERLLNILLRTNTNERSWMLNAVRAKLSYLTCVSVLSSGSQGHQLCMATHLSVDMHTSLAGQSSVILHKVRVKNDWERSALPFPSQWSPHRASFPLHLPPSHWLSAKQTQQETTCEGGELSQSATAPQRWGKMKLFTLNKAEKKTVASQCHTTKHTAVGR